MSEWSLHIKANKDDIRQECRKRRKAITSEDRQKASESTLRCLESLDKFKQSNKIACYLSYASEFATQNIIELIWQCGKRCYLPVLNSNNQLDFVLYSRDMVLAENQHGIKEPQDRSETIEPDELDLVITPLLAFDRQGHRLGAGKGYYDKTFKQRKNAYMLGLAFACQEEHTLPEDKWDVMLDSVLTEKELIVCR